MTTGLPKLPPRPPKRKPSKPFDGYDSAAGSSSVERSSSRSSVFVSTSSPSYDGRSNQPSEITESSKGHEGGPRVFTSPEDVLASLSRGDNPEATARLGEMLGLPPEKLQATASALLTGNVQDVPSEVMHLAFERTLAANSMTAGAPAAAPASITSRGGTSRTERPTLVAPPGFYVHPHPQAAHSVNMPFKPIPSTKSELASANLALGIDDEQTQDWLYLYRGTFLKYTDVMYGSILTTMAVILFWTGILSFSVALWILPIFMVAGVRVILVGAAGIPAPMLPYSKLPAGVVLAWEVTAIATFLISMLPMLRDVWFEVYSMVLLTGLALYLKLRAFLTDPGTVPAAHPRPPPLPPMQLAAMQATNPYHCFTCGIYRPIRSKHCSACDRCVAEFDHHCPVVANCIGRNNRRHFVGYLLALATAEILWLRLALLYWKRILQTVVLRTRSLPSTAAVVRYIFRLGALLPGTAFMSVLVVAIFIGTLWLTARQLFVVASNLTVNEMINRDRYGYLKAKDGSYWNPFDVGVFRNCLEFWTGTEPTDWYDMYTRRKDLDPTVESKPWTGTGLLRQMDAIRLALVEIRRRQQREREDRLLHMAAGRKHVEDLESGN